MVKHCHECPNGYFSTTTRANAKIGTKWLDSEYRSSESARHHTTHYLAIASDADLGRLPRNILVSPHSDPLAFLNCSYRTISEAFSVFNKAHIGYPPSAPPTAQQVASTRHPAPAPQRLLSLQQRDARTPMPNDTVSRISVKT